MRVVDLLGDYATPISTKVATTPDRGSAHDSELEDGHAAHDRSRGDDGDDDRSLPAPASAGLISIGDVVKARIMQAEQDVDSLRTYVAHSA
jgi:hypothetical protein